MKSLNALSFLAASLSGVAVFANSPNPQIPRLPAAIGGGQTGFMDVQRLPTSKRINGQWVLPRGGTVEKLMAMGYVPSPTSPNVFVPNLKDKRYKPHRNYYYMPALVTGPSASSILNVGQSPRQPTFQDPFAGVANPLIRKYTPIPGAGANPGGVNPNVAPGGPLLLPPGPPALDNSPFAPGIGAPGQVAPGLGQPAVPQAPLVAPRGIPPQPAVPVVPAAPQATPPAVDPNDPFLNQPPNPRGTINPTDPNTFPGDQDRLRRLFLDRQQQRLRQERDIRELKRPAPASRATPPAKGVGVGSGLA